MNFFRYKLIAPSGEVFSNVAKLPYDNVLSATSHLERDGSITIYVRRLGTVPAFLFKILSLRIRKKLARPVMAEMLSNLALMLRSGIPLISALEEVAATSEQPEISSNVNDIVLRIQGGMTFSAAAKDYHNIFPLSVYHLIRIGEETGNLDQLLKDASEHLKRIQGIISDTKQALLYPAFVFIAMGAGFLFWFYYVVPKILALFTEMDVALPQITIWVLYISTFIQNYILYILSGLAAFGVITVLSLKKSRRFRKTGDQLMLKVPVAGSIVNASVLAFIAEYFSLLLNAGIEILQATKILKESMKNEVFREKLDDIHGRLKKGEGIAGSFKGTGIFPPYVVRMINIGEMSGTLTEQLDSIAAEYRNKLSILVATIGKSIEPLVLVVAGSMFLIIIIALFLPIYDLVGTVGG